MEKQLWLIYAIAAGLCWGTYVPLVQQGIRGLGMNSFASFLCVGIAYFLIAILFPIAMFYSGQAEMPRENWNVYGVSFATLAGAAGAFGALFVIFANRAVPRGADYRMYIGPVIFALAPVLNTVISLFWHPNAALHEAFHFGVKTLPGWKFYVGILLTGAGAALVFFSKEEAEEQAKKGGHAQAIVKPAEPAPVVAPPTWNIEFGAGASCRRSATGKRCMASSATIGCADAPDDGLQTERAGLDIGGVRTFADVSGLSALYDVGMIK